MPFRTQKSLFSNGTERWQDDWRSESITMLLVAIHLQKWGWWLAGPQGLFPCKAHNRWAPCWPVTVDGYTSRSSFFSFHEFNWNIYVCSRSLWNFFIPLESQSKCRVFHHSFMPSNGGVHKSSNVWFQI